MSEESKHTQRYAHLKELAGRLAESSPGMMQAFGKLQGETMRPGALDRKTKELMSLAIAIAGKCEGWVTFHTHDALRAGATRQEVEETIGVAVMMGGGPAVVYGCEAYEALEQFAG